MSAVCPLLTLGEGVKRSSIKLYFVKKLTNVILFPLLDKLFRKCYNIVNSKRMVFVRIL